MRTQWLFPVVGILRQKCFGASLPKFVQTIQSQTQPRYLFLCKRCLSSHFNHVTPLFLKAEHYVGRTAIIDQHGTSTYDEILHHSSVLFREIVTLSGLDAGSNLDGKRVSFLCENDVSYVVTQWATWMAGGIAVPLCTSHPVSELEYFVSDSESSLLLATEKYAEAVSTLSEKLKIPYKILKLPDFKGDVAIEKNSWFNQDEAKRGPRRMKSRYDDLLETNQFKNQQAMIIYTSGTTGRPKGVVLTHGNLSSMINGMIKAWEWRRDDVILHVLPLHHVHGVVNVLMTPLFVGAICVMMPKFDDVEVWSRLINPVSDAVRGITVFMAVPTVYAKMLNSYKKMYNGRQLEYHTRFVKSVCTSRIRLMVSGSAALPRPIMEQWKEVTGHTLLERYGMTEIGMALTNPLHGKRTPGAVGNPFPGVEVCIARSNVYSASGYDVLVKGDDRKTTVLEGDGSEHGELMVKGPSVFHEYWNKPDATAQSFTKDGWFKTGDTAVYENGAYHIVGRTSVDVIKSGGYKISALDVERHLLAHPDVQDCAVVGLPDITWGQKVAAILVLKDETTLTLDQLRSWLQGQLPPYQLPTVLQCLEDIPRNTMGKVNKKELMVEVFPDFFKKKL